ncbi:MAG: hypothetical protein N3G48_06675 [Sulfolobales archaeon]|nr:hypothetical protein [Sulfolobales archaeon]
MSKGSMRRRGKILLTISVSAIVVIAGVFTYWYLSQPSIAWLFKGAYAKYYGEASFLIITARLDMHLEIVDYNSTHAKLLMYMKVRTPLGSSEIQNVTWVDLSKKVYNVEGYDLMRTYEQEIYVEGLGSRVCIIYEYASKTAPRTLMTMYVDKRVGWPIKMKLSFEATQNIPGMSLDLTLTESNIPGLKR